MPEKTVSGSSKDYLRRATFSTRTLPDGIWRRFAAPSTTALRTGSSGSNKDVVLQIINDSINIRPTVNRDFVKGEWVSGNFSYQLA